jgi:hypothetical protein
MKNIVQDRLLEFGVSDESDVVSSTTDGCPMMKKFGRLIPNEHWLCVNHSNHLAVSDVLYSKPTENSDQIETETESEDISEDELNGSNDDFDDNDTFDGDNFEILNCDDGDDGDFGYSEADLDEKVRTNLTKVRSAIKFIKASDIRNSILQKFITEMHGKEMELILDMKTRWGTIFAMLERFIFLKESVKKALIDLGQIDLYNCINFQVLEDVVNVVKPVADATNVLSKSDTSILEGDIVMEVLCNNLAEINTDTGKKMLKAVKERYEERKNVLLISLARYLHNPHFFRKRKHPFVYSQKQEVHYFYYSIL